MPAKAGALQPLKLFINYRHDDLGWAAWALYGKLEQRFGAENVFFDNGTLKPGTYWLEAIKSHVGQSAVFLSLIGPKWMPCLVQRMQRPGEDYVVEEIDLAFRSDTVTVIPLLVDDAHPPDRDSLPPSIKALADCQVQRLRQTGFGADVDELITDIIALYGMQPGRAAPRRATAPRARKPVERAVMDQAVPEAGPDTGQAPAVAAPEQAAYSATVRSPPGSQLAPAPDENHYRMVVKQAANLVVFLGSGANADDYETEWHSGSAQLPDDRALARYLSSKVGLVTASPHLAEVAQYARVMYGEPEVYGWLRSVLKVESEPGRVHRALARLPSRLEMVRPSKQFQMIVTPKYDAALERALKQANEPFDVAVYMGSGTADAGKFVHVPWNGAARPVNKPNDYFEFPITDDGRLLRTVVVRISGSVDDSQAGYSWEDNYVITEDDYIDYFSGRLPEEVIPGQILAKLKRASYLFLGYSMSDWRLRVFLKRIWEGGRLNRAKYWAVERDPDELEKELCQAANVTLFSSRLTDYFDMLDGLVDSPPPGL